MSRRKFFSIFFEKVEYFKFFQNRVGYLYQKTIQNMSNPLKPNVMKKLMILAAILFSLGTITAKADNDRMITVNQLPQKSQTFIKQHFPNEKVAYAKYERDFLDSTYEIVFTSSAKIEFFKNGDWKEVDCKYSTVPADIDSRQITAYIQQNWPCLDCEIRPRQTRLRSATESTVSN